MFVEGPHQPTPRNPQKRYIGYNEVIRPVHYFPCGHCVYTYVWIMNVFSAQMSIWSVTVRGMSLKMHQNSVWTTQRCLERARQAVGNHLWVYKISHSEHVLALSVTNTHPKFDHVVIFFFLCLAVPENSENEADALLHFTAEFSSRWAVYQMLIQRTFKWYGWTVIMC